MCAKSPKLKKISPPTPQLQQLLLKSYEYDRKQKLQALENKNFGRLKQQFITQARRNIDNFDEVQHIRREILHLMGDTQECREILYELSLLYIEKGLGIFLDYAQKQLGPNTKAIEQLRRLFAEHTTQYTLNKVADLMNIIVVNLQKHPKTDENVLQQVAQNIKLAPDHRPQMY